MNNATIHGCTGHRWTSAVRRGGWLPAVSGLIAAVLVLLIPVNPIPAQTNAAPPMPEIQKQGNEAFVNFSFDQVELRFLVKLVGELTGRRFVIEKDVEGRVTVVTPPQIPLSEIYPLFTAILESCGCSVVERDSVFYITSREKRQIPTAPVIGPGEPMPSEGIITKVIRVVNVSAADLRKALEPMVQGGKTGALAVLEQTNHLIITDTADSVRRLEKIIAIMDQPGLSRMTEVVPLTHATAQEVANELNVAIAGAVAKTQTQGDALKQRLPKPDDGGSGMPFDAVVVAAPHSNSLILVGTPAQVDNLKRIIERMDVRPQIGEGRLRAIFLKYLSSEEAAKSINALFAKGMEKPKNQQIAIEPNVANNALLIEAAPQDFEMVKKLTEELDVPPQQVLVEVVIAEVTMDVGKELGVEFLAAGVPAVGSTAAIGGMKTTEAEDHLMNNVVQGVVPNGLTFGLVKGSYTDASGQVVPRFPALMNITALQTKGNLKILSNVPLWAQNNQKASVNIVKNIPMLKSTIQGGSGTARDVIQNIDRVDVGIKLTVMPHVNPNNEVQMTLNPSIEAIIQESSAGQPFTPTIAKREVNTTVTIPDGQIIVISGLMSENTVSRVRKIPILGSIPLLGWLFRSTVEATERTNLLIFVTPHVIHDMKTADAFREAIQAKTKLDTTIGTNATVESK